MTYTTSTTNDGRSKVEFTAPYAFVAHRPKTPEGLAACLRLGPTDRAAARAFLEGLTDDRLASFAASMVDRMDQLQAQIGQYGWSSTSPVFTVHTPSAGRKILAGVWPGNAYVVDLRFTPDGGFDLNLASIDADAGTDFDLFAAQCGESNYGLYVSELTAFALELAAALNSGS